MSLFNKVLASVGIGGAQVDTKLERDALTPGDSMRGIVEILGGTIDQEIDSIYLTLNTTYLKEIDDKKHTMNTCIDRFKIAEPFTIRAGERKEIPFSFTLPLDTPITIGRTKIWLATGLDITNAVDPTDKDYIRVVPSSGMSAILTAVEELGFRLREADCEQAPYRMGSRLPFVQEFEFVPAAGPFRGRLDELEVVLLPNHSGQIEVLIQIDRRARGLSGLLSEALSMDESYARFIVHAQDISSVRQQILGVLERFS